MTFPSLKFCFVCKKTIEIEGDRCPNCGLQLRENQRKKLFLSERSGSKNIPIHLKLGTTLMDRFEIKRFIANGRSGSVYLAEDHIRSIEVCLKVLDLGPLGKDQSIFRSRFGVMAYNRIADFSHIIKLYDTQCVPWGASGLLLLSSEYANGGTFREWLIKHQEDLEARTSLGVEYFKQVCKGVLSLHNSRIVHPDLKPENMMFSNNKLKILSLGDAICTEHRPQPNDYSCKSDQVEEGSPRCMGPECFYSPEAEIDQRADIYSLGVILYEVLHTNGHLPAQKGDLHFEHPASQLPEASEKLLKVLRRCLAKDPGDRYQNMEAFLIDLDDKPEIDVYKNTPSPECETRDLAQIEEIWQRASRSFSDGKFEDATGFAKEVLFLQPEHSQALQLREEIRSRFNQANQIYQEIAKNSGNRNLDELVELMVEASEIYPEHPSGSAIQASLSANTKKYCQSMEAGMLALQEAQWEIALRYFSEAYAVNSGEIQLKPMIEKLSAIEEARKKTDRALMDGNFDEAQRIACFIDFKIEEVIDF